MCLGSRNYKKKGGLIFRSGSKTLIPWGGSGYPNGELAMWNDSIHVPEGNYKVIVNFEDMKYEFIKL